MSTIINYDNDVFYRHIERVGEMFGVRDVEIPDFVTAISRILQGGERLTRYRIAGVIVIHDHRYGVDEACELADAIISGLGAQCQEAALEDWHGKCPPTA